MPILLFYHRLKACEQFIMKNLRNDSNKNYTADKDPGPDRVTCRAT